MGPKNLNHISNGRQDLLKGTNINDFLAMESASSPTVNGRELMLLDSSPRSKTIGTMSSSAQSLDGSCGLSNTAFFDTPAPTNL